MINIKIAATRKAMKIPYDRTGWLVKKKGPG